MIRLARIRSAFDRFRSETGGEAESSRDLGDPVPVAAILEEAGLGPEGPAVATMPGWRRPTKILVHDASPRRLAWLAEVAPGVDLMSYRTAEEGLRLVQGADAIIGWHTAEMLRAGGALRWVQVHTAGVEGVLSDEHRRLLVTNLKRVSAPAIAEHTVAMVLHLLRGLDAFQAAQVRRSWLHDDTTWPHLDTLAGKVVVLVGTGGVGSHVARLVSAFGATAIGLSLSGTSTCPYIAQAAPVDQLASLLPRADVVVTAVPLTSRTRGMFGREAFSNMKRSALFVNVSRGPVVNTEALDEALARGLLAGAALDVVDPEPLPRRHPLWRRRNVIITPHVAGNGRLLQERGRVVMRENLRRYVSGEPMLAVVDTRRGY